MIYINYPLYIHKRLSILFESTQSFRLDLLLLCKGQSVFDTTAHVSVCVYRMWLQNYPNDCLPYDARFQHYQEREIYKSSFDALVFFCCFSWCLACRFHRFRLRVVIHTIAFCLLFPNRILLWDRLSGRINVLCTYVLCSSKRIKRFSYLLTEKHAFPPLIFLCQSFTLS